MSTTLSICDCFTTFLYRLQHRSVFVALSPRVASAKLTYSDDILFLAFSFERED